MHAPPRVHARSRGPISPDLFVSIVCVLIPASSLAGPVTLWNEVDGNGSLTVTLDDFGSFGDAFQGGDQWLDLFDPSPDPVAGDLPEQAVTFATAVFFYVDPSEIGDGTHQGVASAHLGISTIYGDGNIICTVTRANSTDNLPTSTDSAFLCTGPNVEFEAQLTQSVSLLDPGPNGGAAAALEQSYSITNAGVGALELIVVKHIDMDTPWSGGGGFNLNDLVGVDFAELDRPQVFAKDEDVQTATLVLRTTQDPWLDPRTVDSVYYVEKQGFTPPPNPGYPGGSCPTYDYGTDFQVWDNYGAPNCWKNFIPGAGHDVPGTSPPTQGDAAIGLQVEMQPGFGQPYQLLFTTVYGLRPPQQPHRIPPRLETRTIQYNTDTACGEFLWTLTNINPVVPGEDFVEIDTFYIDVESGDGGAAPCTEMISPDGWTAELCAGFTNGHALYRFSVDDPDNALDLGGEVHGRLSIKTNGLDATTNPATLIEVPPLSVVLYGAQDQEDAQCNFNFGPTRDGGWSGSVIATAFLPVPPLDAWAKAILTAAFAIAATLALTRARPIRMQPTNAMEIGS